MKLLLTLLLATQLHASNLTLVSCTFTGYESTFNASFYTGLYKGLGGAIYSYRFDAKDYNYCPWSVE